MRTITATFMRLLSFGMSAAWYRTNRFSIWDGTQADTACPFPVYGVFQVSKKTMWCFNWFLERESRITITTTSAWERMLASRQTDTWWLRRPAPDNLVTHTIGRKFFAAL